MEKKQTRHERPPESRFQAPCELEVGWSRKAGRDSPQQPASGSPVSSAILGLEVNAEKGVPRAPSRWSLSSTT